MSDLFVDDTGREFRVHDRSACRGQRCVFHNPTRHGMESWRVVMRETSLVERICPTHGVGHPDPDSLDYFKRYFANSVMGVHGCCGCCRDALKRYKDA